jgi:hypothetical protein
MPGLELVIGYLVGWFVKKSRVVGTRADQEVDRVLDACATGSVRIIRRPWPAC